MIVAARFEGPPGFANGGYLAGLLAGDAPAQVTIRRPVPVERELDFDGVELREAGEAAALATVVPLDSVDVDPPPVVSLDAARQAAAATPLVAHHPFPRCFGCGPDHPSGLHCLPGPVGDGVWAVTWTPEDVSPPFVWSALDCPSSAPISSPTGVPSFVLGRIEAQPSPLRVGEPYVVVSWALGEDGRRRFAASALLDADGGVRGVARATWFAV